MSCEVTSARIDVVPGDTAILQVAITQSDCVSPQDLDGFDTMMFTIKRSNQDPDSAALFRGTLADGDITVVDESNGVIEVNIPPEATTLVRFGRPYYWDVQIESDPTNVYTPRFGTLFASTSQSTRSV